MRNHKIIFLLFSFVFIRCAAIFSGIYTRAEISSLVCVLLYILTSFAFYKSTPEKRPLGFLKSVAAVLLFVGLSYGISTLLSLFIETSSPEITLVQGLIAVLLVPLAEELFYRATLFRMLDESMPPLLSVIFASLIFSLAHSGLSSVIASFVLGVILTLLYKRTGSILLPVICHTANNLLAFFFVLKGY